MQRNKKRKIKGERNPARPAPPLFLPDTPS